MRTWTKVTVVLLLCAAPLFGRARKRFHIFHRGPAVMFATYHGVQQAQNAEIDRLGLPRIPNERALAALVEREELVPIATSSALTVARQLPKNRAYVRPWVNAFLTDLSVAFYAEFGVPLQVNSAVRPVTVQRRIRRWNSNAAPVSGESASAHLSGIAVDLQRRGYTDRQIRWLQFRLLMARSRGDVIVIEEVRHPCFHVAVMGGYPNAAPVPVVSAPQAGPLDLLPAEPEPQPSEEPALPWDIFGPQVPLRFSMVGGIN